MKKSLPFLGFLALALAGLVGLSPAPAPEDGPSSTRSVSSSRPRGTAPSGERTEPLPMIDLAPAGPADDRGAPGADAPPPPPPAAALAPMAPPPAAGVLAMPDDPVAPTALVALDPERQREIALTSRDPGTIQSAVWAIGNRLRLSDEDVDALLEILSRTPEDQADVLRAVLWALSLRPDRLPEAEFVRLALGHEADAVRRTALRALSARATPAAREALDAATRGDAVARNRREAIVLLTIGSEPDRIARAAREALASETDPGVRAQWVNAVGALLGEDGRILLEEVLRSASEAVEAISAAAEALAAADPARAVALATDPSLPDEARELVRSMLAASSSSSPSDLPSDQ